MTKIEKIKERLESKGINFSDVLKSDIQWLLEQNKKLVDGCKAFQELNIHYRIGKTPSEKLFKRLEKAKNDLEEYEGGE